jgi:parallel beta-helix repeat protein
MLRRAFTIALLTLLLTAASAVAIYVQPPKASGTIYIRSDGRVDGTTNIVRNGSLYVFVDDVRNSIVLEKDNIVIDGAGHVLEGAAGTASGNGVSLSGRQNITITNITIRSFNDNIFIDGSAGCRFRGNNITSAYSYAIWCRGSYGNEFSGNNISFNKAGIYFSYDASSSDSAITGNVFSENELSPLDCYNGNNLTVSGNKVTGGSSPLGLTNCKNSNVVGNNVTEQSGYTSLNLVNCNDSSIAGNIVSRGLTQGAFALTLYGSFRNRIYGNTVTQSSTGILVSALAISEGYISSNYNTITDNTIIDNVNGVYLFGNASNNVLDRNRIASNTLGIYLRQSYNATVSNNIITNNTNGMLIMPGSENHSIYGNTIVINSQNGLIVENSSYNIFSENNIAENGVGISLAGSSSNNTVWHNNFLNNTNQAQADSSNTWDNGSSGNYWSDYEGTGEQYTINGTNKDRFPLNVPFDSFPIFSGEKNYTSSITGNVTVARLAVEQNKTLTFKTTGRGYVNMTIPRELLDGSFKVYVDDTPTPYLPSWTSTSISVCFETKTSDSHIVKIEGQIKLQGDINCDGTVNILDISIVARQFGQNLNP